MNKILIALCILVVIAAAGIVVFLWGPAETRCVSGYWSSYWNGTTMTQQYTCTRHQYRDCYEDDCSSWGTDP